MLSDWTKFQEEILWATVLILVLVDYALWRQRERRVQRLFCLVLILVLVDYALWLSSEWPSTWMAVCLNPCSGGLCSLTYNDPEEPSNLYLSLNPCSGGLCSLTCNCSRDYWHHYFGLNPCSGGLCSLTYQYRPVPFETAVLILVLVDYALWLDQSEYTGWGVIVLILVLVDYALWRVWN